MRWQLGNGNKINFWIHAWCHESPLVELLHMDSSGTLDNNLKVNAFISSDKTWDEVKLSQV